MAIWSVVSSILGWAYFLAWSVSFYPQLLLNYKRKAVTGLSLDFVTLNILGFACYSVYGLAFALSRQVQDEYRARYPGEAGIPIRINDIVFAMHATVLSILTLSQAYLCKYTKAHDQKISPAAKAFVLASLGLIVSLSLLQYFGRLQWLDVIYTLSYIKLAVTLTKYVPQLWLNHKRKSTKGWSMVNILLDFVGGTLSMSRE